MTGSAKQADSIIIKEMERTKSASSLTMTWPLKSSQPITSTHGAMQSPKTTLLSAGGFVTCNHNAETHHRPSQSITTRTQQLLEMEEATLENDSDPKQEQEPGHEKRRIEFLYRSVMGQIAFACNRRNNAMQHHNGLMTLACGANDRLTTVPYECGLTTSRWATLQAAASLTKENSTNLKEIGSNKYLHMTVDNIDVTHHVNDQQLNRRTELLHGTLVTPTFRTGIILPALATFEPTLHIKRLYRESISSISSHVPNPTRHLQLVSKLRYIEHTLDWFLILASVVAILDAHHPLSSS